jgi:hypothetical protein
LRIYIPKYTEIHLSYRGKGLLVFGGDAEKGDTLAVFVGDMESEV